MKYSQKEINIMKESIGLGSTYKEISDFIEEDLGIRRTIMSLNKKGLKLGLKSISKNKSHTQFIYEMRNRNIKILEKYINTRTKLKVECNKCANVWKTTPDHLLRGSGCPECAISNQTKTTIQFINELKVISPTIKVIDNYINSKSKIKVMCLIDDSVWKATPDHLLGGSGCPKCVKGGFYQNLNKNIADTLDFPLYLYHVKLQYEDEIFYKYGLTSRLNKQRFKEYKPYKVVEEISFKEYDAWTAICKEKALKSNYTPKYKFGGWTECYKEIK